MPLCLPDAHAPPPVRHVAAAAAAQRAAPASLPDSSLCGVGRRSCSLNKHAWLADCRPPAPVPLPPARPPLCPTLQHMVRDVLAPMFSNGVAALADIRYIAFGNVRNRSDGGYAYQHGEGAQCARHRRACT